MKVIIAGSREIHDYDRLCKVITRSQFENEITEVVSGTCHGVDLLGERWANENHIPIKRFPAQWDLYGRSAGPIRNRQMALYADALIALMIIESRGTLNMINTAISLKLKTYYEIYS